MKELLIEEKTKAYDEAIEKAKNYHKQLLDEDNPEWANEIEKIFPELKESEDEKIRKVLLNDFKNNCSEYFCEGINRDMVIAWLEKQGHDGKKWIYEDVYIKEKEQLIQDGIDEVLENPQKYGLEKQGEQKSVNIDIESIVNLYKQRLKSQGGIENSPLVNMCLTSFRRGVEIVLEKLNLKELKKQGEQKPADKVEPKFHKGEWIVWQDKCYKVNYNGCGYELVDKNGLSTSLEYGTIDENAHLWDITKDAKDGDMLATSAGAFIYNGNNGGGSCPGSYFGIDTLGRLKTGVKHHWTGKKVFPATKEQRDTLIKAMADAGYTFDFVKKELKKIEQKSAENKGMNLVEEEMTPFQKEVFCIIDTAIEEEQGLKQVCDKLFALASNEIKQNPAKWSEEDENRINRLIAYFEDKESFTAEDDVVYANWLKSLKDRVGCEVNCTTTKE